MSDKDVGLIALTLSYFVMLVFMIAYLILEVLDTRRKRKQGKRAKATTRDEKP